MNPDLVDTIILASGIVWNRYGSNEIISRRQRYSELVYNAPAGCIFITVNNCRSQTCEYNTTITEQFLIFEKSNWVDFLDMLCNVYD